MNYQYQVLSFDKLSTTLLYDILHLRSEVFVVEQNSAYLDPDGMDNAALHLCMLDDNKLIGYARIFAPGVKFDEASVGRLVIDEKYRGDGLGKKLLEYSMARLCKQFPGAPIRIEAQHHLRKFYESLGFVIISDIYDWGGIPHVKMVCSTHAVV